MQDLLPLAEQIGARLKTRKETIAVAESSTGGLISASLLSMAGASVYFMGGSVIYTRTARAVLMGITPEMMEGKRASTEYYANLLATTVRGKFSTSWGIGETGATGPTGNSYGDAPGHCCYAIAGPVSHAFTLETGSPDRAGNMRLFAKAVMERLLKDLE
ncbi:MAG: CinA family protein [Acetobacteraceae bacterium]|nr:CinA family protein [Acetobacteraceae bacterium]